MIRGNPITLGGGSSKKGRPLSALAEGALVSVRENGILRPFYVAKHDYEPDLNGAGRVLLVRKNAHSAKAWNSAGNNAYAGSTIDTFLNEEYANMLSGDVRAAMVTTVFPYTAGNGSTTLGNLQRGVFILSFTEYGYSWTYAPVNGSTLPTASIFKTATNDNGVSVAQWSRTPNTQGTTNAMAMNATGGDAYYQVANASAYARPCFTLPATMEIADEPNADGSYSLLCDAVMDNVGELPAGALVNIEENGVSVPYYVAKHNYESGLNGAGRTLLVRKDLSPKRAMNSSNINAYGTSSVDAWLNGDYANMLSSEVRAIIGVTAFRYTPGNGVAAVNTLQRSVFTLSITELGITHSSANAEGTTLPIVSALLVAYLNGVVSDWWLRTPVKSGNNAFFTIKGTGELNSAVASDNTMAVRPCFTIPYNTKIVTTPNADGSYNLDI